MAPVRLSRLQRRILVWLPPRAYRGLMVDLGKAMAEVTEAAEAHALEGHGGRRKQASQRSLKSHGTTTDYLARRIARLAASGESGGGDGGGAKIPLHVVARRV